MRSTRSKLIELLANNSAKDEYISGQKLSEKLNITRSAIWKHMNELKKDGYIIEGKARKGYRIISFPDKISENTIKWGLNTKWLGQTVHHYEQVDSTQPVAHQLAKDGATEGTLIVADEQTAGQGRMDREWVSENKRGIWFSFILRPNILPVQAPQLTLLTATVIAQSIEQVTGIKPQIKWPNDILLNEKKIAGILTEMQAEQDQVRYIVIGCGINVNQQADDLPEINKYQATSLQLELNKHVNKLTLIRTILENFEQKYNTYLENGFKNIKQQWESYGFKLGHKLNIKSNDREWNGVFIGIAEDGALLAKNEQDEIEKIYSAEITWF